MARGEIKWQFPDQQGGQGGGFNEGGIDKFKFRDSLKREGVQNPLDQWDETTGQPCTVIFKLDEYESSNFFINKNLQGIFKACQKYDAKSANKGDGETFYKNALPILAKKKINVLTVRDFNTNGLPANPHDIGSSYHRLIVAPGTSISTGRGGGSHGHGQKAAFAQSNLRTVFYYSHVDKGIKGLNSKDLFVGKTILNGWVDKSGVDKQPVGYYGDIWVNPKNDRDIKTYPLTGNEIPEAFRRQKLENGKVPSGTDIYILAPKLAKNWTDQVEKDIVTNFFAAIDNGFLKVGIKNKNKNLVYISKENLDMYALKHSSDAAHYLKALREPVTGQPFTKKINKLGTVKLYISQHEGGNQKIALMRRPRMLIQEIPRKVMSNFSGVLLIDDEEGNENLRLAENPNHTRLYKTLMRDHFDAEVDFIEDLYRFIDDKIEELKGATVHEKLEIPGLGNLLPGNKPKDKRGDTETDDEDENAPNKEVKNTEILNLTKPRLKAPRTTRITEYDTIIEDEDGTIHRKKRSRKKIKRRKRYKKGEGNEIGLIPSKDIKIRTYLSKKEAAGTSYFVKTEILKDANGYIGFSFIGEDDVRVTPEISSMQFKQESPKKPKYKIKSNCITFGELSKGDVMHFEITINDNIPASLGVLG